MLTVLAAVLSSSTAHAACTVTLVSPVSGARAEASPVFRWTGDCRTWRVEFSPSGTFTTDRVSAVARTRTYQMSEATWNSYQAGAWAGGVSWRVVGRATDGTSTTSSTRTLVMAPDLDDDGWTEAEGDCDDSNAAVSPAAAEVCDNGVDDDCSGDDDGCRLTGVVDLSAADAILVGEDAGDQAGFSVASAGDVNGDGVDDVIVGAPGAEVGTASDAGAAYLFYGPVSGTLDLSTADAVFTGTTLSDDAGWAVGGGDLNGDGWSDVVLSAQDRDDGGLNAGAVYVFYGPVYGSNAAATADVTIVGENDGDQLGFRIDAAVDLDLDGIDDLVVSAPDQEGGGALAGCTYVFYGPLAGTVDASAADARIYGPAAGDTAGHGLDVGTDLSGDGYPDLLLGGDENDSGGPNSGAAWVVYGPPTGDLVLTTYDARLAGEDPQDFAGNAVATGDVNGDGIGDALVSAPFDDDGGSNAGAVYVVYGPLSGSIDLSAWDAKLTGDVAGLGLGTSVAAIDLNGDGVDDVVVAADSDDAGGTDAGAAWVFYGPVSGARSVATADLELVGEDAGDGTGGAAAGALDMDGDGFDDLVLGGDGDDAGGSGAGAVWVVRGAGG